MDISASAPVEHKSPLMSPPTRFLARQPIVDRHLRIVGYELLLRTGGERSFVPDTQYAVPFSLDNYLTMGYESFVDGKLAFINCTREALVRKLVAILPPATTVLEVLETVEPEDEVVQACRELREAGYRIALDDFTPRPGMGPLIGISDYIKVDVRVSDAAMRREIRKALKGSSAALLAEKVEDGTEFELTRAEGYDYFQGYFFCRPKTEAAREIPSNRMNYVRLLAEIAQRPMRFERVRDIVRSEASLLYRVLRLANSPITGRRGAVSSFGDALMLIGEERFCTLVSVAAATAMAGTKPVALVSISLIRARFCELLAPHLGLNATEQFLIGLLSVVDAMLDLPIRTVVETMPLRVQAKSALIARKGPLATPLNVIHQLEIGAWGNLIGMVHAFGVDEAKIMELYFEAVRWASEALEISTPG